MNSSIQNNVTMTYWKQNSKSTKLRSLLIVTRFPLLLEQGSRCSSNTSNSAKYYDGDRNSELKKKKYIIYKHELFFIYTYAFSFSQWPLNRLNVNFKKFDIIQSSHLRQ